MTKAIGECHNLTCACGANRLREGFLALKECLGGGGEGENEEAGWPKVA